MQGMDQAAKKQKTSRGLVDFTVDTMLWDIYV